LIDLCKYVQNIHGGVDASRILRWSSNNEMVTEEIVSASLVINDALIAGNLLCVWDI
jgi:hypothetical protein